ncbi:hypothetical protein HRbin04_00639 [archaeon HR04]|nr:hypothetical protein HRbin04_00639 [archaeon HR04]
MSINRPLGVTIIAVIMAIGGIILTIIGAAMIGIAGTTSISSSTSTIDSTVFTILLLVIGPIVLVLGVTNFVVSYGLFKGKEWAWAIAVLVLIMGIAITAVQMAITKWIGTDAIGNVTGSVIGIVINGIILYYLFRPHVKTYFRRVPAY